MYPSTSSLLQASIARSDNSFRPSILSSTTFASIRTTIFLLCFLCNNRFVIKQLIRQSLRILSFQFCLNPAAISFKSNKGFFLLSHPFRFALSLKCGNKINDLILILNRQSKYPIVQVMMIDHCSYPHNVKNRKGQSSPFSPIYISSFLFHSLHHIVAKCHNIKGYLIFLPFFTPPTDSPAIPFPFRCRSAPSGSRSSGQGTGGGRSRSRGWAHPRGQSRRSAHRGPGGQRQSRRHG